jgi:outer membrane protein assembly factor BamB
MENNLMKKSLIVVLTFFFFIVTLITPMVIGINNIIRSQKILRSDRADIFNCYHNSDAIFSLSLIYSEEKTYNKLVKKEVPETRSKGLTNSSWPMFSHDTQHTGQSPYSTESNLGNEKWRFERQNDFVDGSPVIADDGTIYVGSINFCALYPNGTLKWRYASFEDGYIWSAPAIDENGTIYVGLVYNSANSADFYAFKPNGAVKWIYSAGGADIFSSPAIGNDGTIYFGDGNNYINALYPNGTLKWRYLTGDVVYSSPAIGNDGTVFCGSHDGCMYALYPNNGTLIWRFATSGWIRTSPCIAEDGTIYCVSLDNYLYAVYPNGTMKWRTFVNAGTSPTIGQDGTIYAGWDLLYAVNPTNGSVRWTFNPGPNRTIEGATPAHSADGTIFFGTHINDHNGGEIISVNPDGTEKWRKLIADMYVDSAPAIGEDGTVYIGSASQNTGYLYAFGPGEQKTIEIQQPEQGKLYLFGLGLSTTLSGNTVIVGSVKIKVNVCSATELQSLHFYIDGTEQSTITAPPFEWKMNQRYGTLFPLKHTLTVTANYNGGCQSSESIDVLYFHLL